MVFLQQIQQQHGNHEITIPAIIRQIFSQHTQSFEVLILRRLFYCCYLDGYQNGHM